MASIEIVELRASGEAVLETMIQKTQQEPFSPAPRRWCKKVTSTAVKKRLDDVEILPTQEAAFTP